MSIIGFLLAAGMSTRMNGINKLLLPLRDSSIVEVSLKNMMESPLDQIVVVLGHDSQAMTERLDRYQSERVRLVVNRDYRTGRASSIKRGLDQSGEDWEAVLFIVADKPTVSSALITKAIDMYRSQRPYLLCVKTPQGRGHPIIFDRRLFKELSALNGDQVGQELIEKYETEIVWIESPHEQININRPEDYQRLLTRGKDHTEAKPGEDGV